MLTIIAFLSLTTQAQMRAWSPLKKEYAAPIQMAPDRLFEQALASPYFESALWPNAKFTAKDTDRIKLTATQGRANDFLTKVLGKKVDAKAAQIKWQAFRLPDQRDLLAKCFSVGSYDIQIIDSNDSIGILLKINERDTNALDDPNEFVKVLAPELFKLDRAYLENHKFYLNKTEGAVTGVIQHPQYIYIVDHATWKDSIHFFATQDTAYFYFCKRSDIEPFDRFGSKQEYAERQLPHRMPVERGVASRHKVF